MAELLYFQAQQIGDVVLRVEPADQLMTPPTRRTGLFQNTSDVNSDSRNLLYAQRFFVALTRSDNLALNQALSAIQGLQGLLGDLEVKRDSVVKMLCTDWTIESVGQPALPDGFGGRLARELLIFAVGPSLPSYF